MDAIEQTKVFIGRLIPGLTVLLLIFIASSPLRLPGWADAFPNLGLIAVFYWGAHRPGSLQPWVLFALGFLQDILLPYPLGLTAFGFLVLQWLMITQRRLLMGRTFLGMWGVFAGVALFLTLLNWLVFCLDAWRWLPLTTALLQYMLTALLYPVFAWLLIQAHRLITDPL